MCGYQGVCPCKFPLHCVIRLCLPDELCLFLVPQPDVLCQCSAVLIKGKFPLGASCLCEKENCVVATLYAKLLCFSLQTQATTALHFLTLFLPRCITLITTLCLSGSVVFLLLTEPVVLPLLETWHISVDKGGASFHVLPGLVFFEFLKAKSTSCSSCCLCNYFKQLNE